MKLLVTGGAGFIGSNFIKLVLAEQRNWSVTNLDLLTYAGNPLSLRAEATSPIRNWWTILWPTPMPWCISPQKATTTIR